MFNDHDNKTRLDYYTATYDVLRYGDIVNLHVPKFQDSISSHDKYENGFEMTSKNSHQQKMKAFIRQSLNT